MPATAGMSTTVEMQAVAVMPARSKRKDDSNSMTTHNSRNTIISKNDQKQGHQHSRDASKSRDAAKVVNLATACKKANNNMDMINISDDSSSSREAGQHSSGMTASAAGPHN